MLLPKRTEKAGLQEDWDGRPKVFAGRVDRGGGGIPSVRLQASLSCMKYLEACDGPAVWPSCYATPLTPNWGWLQDEVLRRAVALHGAKNWRRIGAIDFNPRLREWGSWITSSWLLA